MAYRFGMFIPDTTPERYRLGADMLACFFLYDDAFDGRYAVVGPAEAVSWAGRLTRIIDDPHQAMSCNHPGMIAAHNDLFSFRKEQQDNAGEVSMLTALLKERNVLYKTASFSSSAYATRSACN